MVKRGGMTYKIPEMWLLGYTLGHKGTTMLDAIDAWIEQVDLGDTVRKVHKRGE